MFKTWTITVFAAALAAGGCTKKADNAKEPATPQKEEAAREPADKDETDGEKKGEGGETKEGRVAPGAPRGVRGPAPGAAGKDGPQLVQLWSTGGLKVPESVLYDRARKVLYVSCINGKPTEKNGKGFIAKLSPDGKIKTLEWAKGMNAPKGMALKGDTLFVTDIDRVHQISVKTGKITQTIPEPKAKFLNDIAIGPKGRVFISDMKTGQVHVLKGKKLAPFSDLTALRGANGMLLHHDKLLVGTATGIAQVDLSTGKASLYVPVKGFGMIDGLRSYGKDAWIVSKWKGLTQMVRKDGTVTVLKDTTPQNIQSADLEYDAATRTLFIPTFFHDHVVAYRVKPNP